MSSEILHQSEYSDCFPTFWVESGVMEARAGIQLRLLRAKLAEL